MVDINYRIFGDFFSKTSLQWYFFNSNTDKFVEARLRHLSFLYNEAIDDYDYLYNNPSLLLESLNREFKNITLDKISSEVLYFKSMALQGKGDYSACINSFEYFLNKHPESRWKSHAIFNLGYCFEMINEIDKGKELYVKSIEEARDKFDIRTFPAYLYLYRLNKSVN